MRNELSEDEVENLDCHHLVVTSACFHTALDVFKMRESMKKLFRSEGSFEGQLDPKTHISSLEVIDRCLLIHVHGKEEDHRYEK